MKLKLFFENEIEIIFKPKRKQNCMSSPCALSGVARYLCDSLASFI